VKIQLSEGVILEFRLPLVGHHNARNATAAAAAAEALGRSPADITAGLAGARPARNRSEIVEVGGRHVLCDLYNANPTSTRAALDTVAGLAAGARAVAVLGDMLELGAEAATLHREVGAHAARRGLHGLITVGTLGREIAAGAEAAGMAASAVLRADDKHAAAAWAAVWTRPGDWIVIKGSRGMRMEEVLFALREELG
jgi:UDP-N-acetylmuramoyl-tripeptide--D-alanyl-D-alanine ligase